LGRSFLVFAMEETDRAASGQVAALPEPEPPTATA